MRGFRVGRFVVALARRDPLLFSLLGAYVVLALLVPQARRPWRLVDWQALAAVVAVMAAARGLDLSGALARSASTVAPLVSRSLRLQALLLTVSGVLLATIAMNDNVILVYAPMAVGLAEAYGAEPAPLVAFTAIAVNIGSSLTPVGNPQNIII